MSNKDNEVKKVIAKRKEYLNKSIKSEEYSSFVVSNFKRSLGELKKGKRKKGKTLGSKAE